jgi:hypothetical protein
MMKPIQNSTLHDDEDGNVPAAAPPHPNDNDVYDAAM